MTSSNASAPALLPDRPADAHSPPPGRRERRRLELFERILEAAEELFLERGYDDTKVTDICERADIAYGTFFNHFPTKQDLLTAMGDQAVAEISQELDALTKHPVDIETALVALFESAAERLQSVSPHQRALAARVQALAFTDPPTERNRSFHDAFASFLEKGAEEGRVRDDLPTDTLTDLVSSAYATLTLRWVHIDAFPVRERAAALASLLAETLAPPHEAAGEALASGD